MSFYLMNNHSSLRNILKIGYMSTTNIKHIISRYATGCGNNITVFQFLDHDPKHMETLFKKQFEPQNVELSFSIPPIFFSILNGVWTTRNPHQSLVTEIEVCEQGRTQVC